MSINFIKDNSIHRINGGMPSNISGISHIILAFKIGNNTQFIYFYNKRSSSLLVNETGNYRYIVDTSYPSLCIRHNGQTYYSTKSLKTEIMNYQIPAGTYSPSIFDSLISQYIGQNSSRQVTSSFSVIVNGQTVNVPANSYVYYNVSSSSPNGRIRSVSFINKNGIVSSYNGPMIACNSAGSGFSYYKTYVTYMGIYNDYRDSFYYQDAFYYYSKYNIQVVGNISFK